MQQNMLVCLVLACASGLTPAQDAEIKIAERDIRALGPLPDEKSAEVVGKTERNPFAERSAHGSSPLAEDTESEDARLRAVIAKLPLSGRISNSDGRQGVLFAGALLHEGDRLPPLLPDQTVLLRISSIKADKVEISWVEDQASVTPRKIVRPIKLNQARIREMVRSYGDKGDSTASQFLVPRTTGGEYLKAEAPRAASDPRAASATAAETEDPIELPAPPSPFPATPERSNPLKK